MRNGATTRASRAGVFVSSIATTSIIHSPTAGCPQPPQHYPLLIKASVPNLRTPEMCEWPWMQHHHDMPIAQNHGHRMPYGRNERNDETNLNEEMNATTGRTRLLASQLKEAAPPPVQVNGWLRVRPCPPTTTTLRHHHLLKAVSGRLISSRPIATGNRPQNLNAPPLIKYEDPAISNRNTTVRAYIKQRAHQQHPKRHITPSTRTVRTSVVALKWVSPRGLCIEHSHNAFGSLGFLGYQWE